MGFKRWGFKSNSRRREGQFYEGEGYVLPADGNLDRPHSKMSEWGEKENVEWPKRKRRGKSKPLEVELDLGGGYPRGNLLMSSLFMSSLENGKVRIW